MCKVCFVLGRVFDCLGQGLRHFWARLLTVLGRVCFDAIDLAHCLCLVGRCGGVFAGKVCALKSDRAHDVRRSCPKPSQTMPNGGEQGTGWGRLHGAKGCMGSRNGAVSSGSRDAWGQRMHGSRNGAASSGSRDEPRSPADLDGQAGGGELGEAVGLVLFRGGGEGERFRVVGGAQALVLAFADVMVGKEVHFIGLAV